MFANRFFGNGDWNGQNAQNIEVQTQLQDIRTQMQNNQNSNLLMDAIKGNYSAIQQLAQNLNCDFNTLQQCCCNMQSAIQQVAGQVGFSAERVINAANMAYADYYPDLLKDENSCIEYAYLTANDVDGYEGMIFYRWISDIMGKLIKVDWKKFI